MGAKSSRKKRATATPPLPPPLAAPFAFPRAHDAPVLCCSAAGTSSLDVISGSDDRSIAMSRWAHPSSGGSGKVLRRWRGHKKAVHGVVSSAALGLGAGRGKASSSSSGGFLYSCSRDLTIRQWSLAPRPEEDKECAVRTWADAHEFSITALDLHADGRRLCSGARDTAVCVWDTASATSAAMARAAVARNMVTDVKWVPAGSTTHANECFVQAGEDLRLRVWDARVLTAPVGEMVYAAYFPLCLDVSTDGTRVITGSKGFDGTGCEVQVWDLRHTSKALHSFSGHHTQDVTGCIFVGDIGVTASKDGSVRTWDVERGCALDCYHHGGAASSSVMFTGLARAPEEAYCAADAYASTFASGMVALDLGVSGGRATTAGKVEGRQEQANSKKISCVGEAAPTASEED